MTAPDGTPHATLVRISGGAYLSRPLERGDELHLQIGTMDGEIIADGYGHVFQVADKDIRKNNEVVETQQIFTVKIS